MRPLRYSINVTLDGCCHHEAGLPPDEESMRYWTAEMERADALLFGRVTQHHLFNYAPDVPVRPTSSSYDPICIDVGVGLGDVLEAVRRSRSEADRAVCDAVEEALKHGCRQVVAPPP